MRRLGTAALFVLAIGSCSHDRAPAGIAHWDVAGLAVDLGARGAQIEHASGIAVSFALRGEGRMQIRRRANGIEDLVTVENGATSIAYDLDVSHASGLRLVERTLEILDRGGTPRIRVTRPWIADANGTVRDAALTVEGCAVDVDPSAPWGRAPVSPGARTCVLRVAWRAAGLRYPVVVDPNWTTTSKMSTPRSAHMSVVLGDGKVLVAGGVPKIGDPYLASAELFDPATATFATTQSAPIAFVSGLGVRLADGRALVVGGYSETAVLPTAVIYDPKSGTFQATGKTVGPRGQGFSVTLLPSGKVLVVGGFGETPVCTGDNDCNPGVGCDTNAGQCKCSLQPYDCDRSAEVFDPATNEFTQSTGEKEVDDPGTNGQEFTRYGAAATLLATGKVLVTGGFDYTNNDEHRGFVRSRLYDPSARTFVATGDLHTPRQWPTATLVPNGQVLIAGGFDNRFVQPYDRVISSAEVFDPNGNAGAGAMTQLATSMTIPRAYAFAMLLPKFGRVVIIGGATQEPMSMTVPQTPTTELWDPLDGSFRASGTMARDRCCTDPVLLDDDRVLVTGGTSGVFGILDDAELYALHGPGEPCGADLDCSSRLCEANVCCKSDVPCVGTCIGCAKGTGECATRPVAEDDPGTCEGKHTCGMNGVCGLADGQPCSVDAECARGFCTDGFCCNRRCDEPCASCAERKLEGICSPISSDTLPRVSCPKGYQCSGKDLACVPPTCDGPAKSVSIDGTVTDCTPYVCAGVCLERCASVDDCLAPFVCDRSGRCVPQAAGSASCAIGSSEGASSVILFAVLGIVRRRRRRPS